MPTKTMYHSALVQAGPTRVTVKGNVMPSKFKGKLPYVMIAINGEDHYLNLENKQCEEFFDGQNGKTFTLQAIGSRDDADFDYLGEGAETAAREDRPRGQAARDPQQRPPQQQQPPREEQQQRATNRPPAQSAMDKVEALKAMKIHVGKNVTLSRVALKGVMKLIEEMSEAGGIAAMLAQNEALHVALFNSCCYGTHTKNWIDHVPVNLTFPGLEIPAPADKKQEPAAKKEEPAGKPKGGNRRPPQQPPQEQPERSDNDGGASPEELAAEGQQQEEPNL